MLTWHGKDYVPKGKVYEVTLMFAIG